MVKIRYLGTVHQVSTRALAAVIERGDLHPDENGDIAPDLIAKAKALDRASRWSRNPLIVTERVHEE